MAAVAPPSVHASAAPLRRCVVCRQVAPKAALGRMARTPAGELRLGAAEGRGAYVHRGGECAASLAADLRPLARALRCAIPAALSGEISRAYGPGQEETT